MGSPACMLSTSAEASHLMFKAMPPHPSRKSSAMPRGIVPVIDTPFDESGAVDAESHARLIDDAIAAGATGLVGPVVASEVHALTRDEREAMVRFCARAIHHRV